MEQKQTEKVLNKNDGLFYRSTRVLPILSQ